MVTRKPVAASADSGLAPDSAPPYPTTPITTNHPMKFRMQDARNQMQTDSPSDSENAWSEEVLDKGKGKAVPESLRVGPPGYTPRSSQEMQRPSATSTNPYLQSHNAQENTGTGQESSAAAWGGFGERPSPAAPAGVLPDREASITPLNSQQMQNLSINEPSTNPWQPSLDTKPTKQAPSIPSLARESSGNEAWAGPPPVRAPPAGPLVDTSQPVLVDIDEPESPAWDEDEPSPVHEMPVDHSKSIQQIHDDRHAWDDEAHPLQQHPVSQTQSTGKEAIHQGEPWNLVDHEPTPIGAQESGVTRGDGQEFVDASEEHAPALPPRRSEEQPPQQPPRPQNTNTGDSSSSLLSPGVRRQKKETYEIKKITWHDVNATENPRISPILVQNANGPCPLLALVNALTLSTPANEETALVETLRSREQVSLGLLLDAVFDELMSGRRGDAAQGLPDVSDLYKFLVTLHTGMNVNPRFIPSPPAYGTIDPRNSMSHVHPSERESSLPGTFEDTREMNLYSTFSIPLIHGWLAEADSPAYAALKRSAQSYEDAQNLMFHEEVLEEKLRAEGLSFEEQATLEDIATIKAFFAKNATQLTSHGLNTITLSMAPGAVAILFRNDHFSTLYRHPNTLQLLQLVTDMGYAGHEEVVWESLIDVNGENAEFFSGDFRLVGGAPQTPSGSNTQQEDGWTPVTDRRQSGQQGHHANNSTSSNAIPAPQSPTEQEDHDFALAMQLQEEEEERHRVETARRRRETELSQQFIEQQGQSTNIPVSQRGGGTPRGRGRGSPPSNRGGINDNPESRPTIPPRRNNTGSAAPPSTDPEAGIDAPPPSYEQAANQSAYVPPDDHPAHPSSSPNTGRRASAYSANSASIGRGGPSRGGRRPTLVDQIPGRSGRGGPTQQQQDGNGKDKDCVVM